MLFLSYARADDEPFVLGFYRALLEAGHDVWWDRQSMPGRSRTYLHELTDAIARTERVLLIVGPGAAESDSVAKEWLFAHEHCIPVLPVLRSGDYSNVPRPFGKLHIVDFRPARDQNAALAEVLRLVGETVPPLGLLYGVPALPGHFLSRADDVLAVGNAVLDEALSNVVVKGTERVLGIVGMGGLGKSVLASAFAHSCEARRYFSEGIVWLTLGRTPDFDVALRVLGRALDVQAESASAPGFSDEMVIRLQDKLRDRRVLVVLDDVWNARDTQHFRTILGPHCRMLLTSRSETVATALRARAIPLGVLDEDASLDMLAVASGQERKTLTEDAHRIAVRCGGLPLALSIMGAMVGKRVDRWQHAFQRLEEADLTRLRHEFPDYPYPSLFAAIDASVSTLDEDVRDRYLELAVFPAAETFPESAARALWKGTGFEGIDAEEVFDTLVARSLLTHTGHATYRLHDLQRDYVISRNDNLPALHGRLLDAYTTTGMWADIRDDGYLFDHLVLHLHAAGRSNDLLQLISGRADDPIHRWFQARVTQAGLNGFLRDLRHAAEHVDELSVDAIARDSGGLLIGTRARYAVIASSVHAAAGSSPSELVRLLLDHRLLSASQAADSALGMAHVTDADALRTLEALLAVADHERCPEQIASDLRSRVWSLIREREAGRQAWLFGHAARLTNADGLEGLRALSKELPEAGNAFAIGALAIAHARLGRFADALHLLRSIADSERRAEALHFALTYLRGASLEEGLVLAEDLDTGRERAWVGATIALAHQNDAERGLALAARIDDGAARSSALIAIAPHLEAAMATRAIAIAQRIEPLSDSFRARAILAQKLDPPSRDAVIDQLIAATRGRYDGETERAADALIPYLPRAAIESRLWLADANEAYPLLRRLAALGFADEALDHLKGFEHDAQKQSAIDRLIPFLAIEHVERAIQIAREFSDRNDRAVALAKLSVRAAELGYPENALRTASGIDVDSWKNDAYRRMAPYLDAAGLAVLRVRLARIGDDTERARAIAQLAGWAPEPWLRPALDTVRGGIEDDVLVPVLQRMCTTLDRATIHHVYAQLVEDRAGTVYASKAALLLLPALDASMHDQVLTTALSAHWDSTDTGFLLRAIVRVLPSLTGELASRVRAFAATAFATLLELLDAARQSAFPLAQVLGPNTVLDHAQRIDFRRHRIGVTAAILPLLDPQRAGELEKTILEEVATWTDPYEIVHGFGEHAEHLTDDIVHVAMRALRTHCDVTNVRPEAVKLATRAATVALDDAIELLATLRSVAGRPDEGVVTVAAAIAQVLPAGQALPLLQEAISEAVRVTNASIGGGRFQAARARCLAALNAPITRLERGDAYALVAAALDGIAQHPRAECATDLAALGPSIHALGGSQAIDQVCRALRDAAVWWP